MKPNIKNKRLIESNVTIVRECWIWNGSKPQGYGNVRIQGKLHRAHRISYEVFKGEIPDGMDVLHSIECTSKACANPEHLRLGDDLQNQIDEMEKGTFQQRSIDYTGEGNPNAKLNEEDVKIIKYMCKYKSYYGLQQELASLYKTSSKYINNIAAGITWKHIKV